MINEMKSVVFEFEGKEETFKANPNASYESLLRSIKLCYDIPDETPLLLFDIDTNTYVVPYEISDLWYSRKNDVPKYRVIIHGKKGKNNDFIESSRFDISYKKKFDFNRSSFD